MTIDLGVRYYDLSKDEAKEIFEQLPPLLRPISKITYKVVPLPDYNSIIKPNNDDKQT